VRLTAFKGINPRIKRPAQGVKVAESNRMNATKFVVKSHLHYIQFSPELGAYGYAFGGIENATRFDNKESAWKKIVEAEFDEAVEIIQISNIQN
jgi:hypothetical protein